MCSKRERWAAASKRMRADLGGGERRAKLAKLKVPRGCTRCGYDRHPGALSFHHRPGTLKVNSISQMMHASKAAIEAEVAKCDVLCANCHMEETYAHQG